MLRALTVALVAAFLLLAAGAGRSGAVTWLCKPGLPDDACAGSLTTTRFSPAGERLGVDRVRRARHRRADCFYVYPTVSGQPRPQADLTIDPELRSIALYQAARYARDCRVFAPVYRQITLQGLFDPATVTDDMAETAYADVRDAWRAYLRHHNHGRGVVLIGHSQGTFMLRRLIAEEIDRTPRLRRRLVSAVLLGGNVLVRHGRRRGGDFAKIPACAGARLIGCVVAFSAYGETPPADALFGRTSAPGREVLCTNPASLAAGPARVTPILPSAPFAAGAIGSQVAQTRARLPAPPPSRWMAFPKAYVAQCVSEDGATVLQVAPRAGAPVLPSLPTPAWGLHLQDANIALGELSALVRRQIHVYETRR